MKFRFVLTPVLAREPFPRLQQRVKKQNLVYQKKIFLKHIALQKMPVLVDLVFNVWLVQGF